MQPNSSPTPQFPAWLQFHGSPELLYLADSQALAACYQQEYLLADDRLIDSRGDCFSLSDAAFPCWQQQLSLPELDVLLQAHFFAEQQSCVSKFQSSSAAAAIAALAP